MTHKTIEDVRDLKPCYDPNRHLSEDWTGTICDFLSVDKIPPQDRIWVVTHWLDDKTNRLFAVWCAREAIRLVKDPDPRSVNACDVAEKFAKGEATQAELDAAKLEAATAVTAAAANTIVAVDAARAAALAIVTAAHAGSAAVAQAAAAIAAGARVAVDAATAAAATVAVDAAAAARTAAAWDAVWTIVTIPAEDKQFQQLKQMISGCAD